jgi:hypothetical protein
MNRSIKILKHMKTTFKFLLFVFLLLIQNKSIAKQNEAIVADLRNRILLVEIQEEDENVVAELKKNPKKAKQLANYKKGIVDFNTSIKKTIQKYWTFNSQIEYKTFGEINALKSNSSEAGKYAYFEFEYVSHYDYRKENSAPKFLIETGYLKLFLMGSKKSIVTIPLIKTLSKEVEIVYAIKQMDSFMRAFESGIKPDEIAKRNASLLSRRTLLLDSLKTDSTLLAMGSVSGLPFEVQFVNSQYIENKIIKDESNQYAFVLFTYIGDKKAVKTIVLMEDLLYAGTCKANGVDIEKTSKVTLKDLTEFAKYIP